MSTSFLTTVASLFVLSSTYVVYYVWTSRVVYPRLGSLFGGEETKESSNPFEFQVYLDVVVNLTITLSIKLIEIYLFQITGFLNGDVNKFVFRLNLMLLLLLILVVIPFITICMLTNHLFENYELGGTINSFSNNNEMFKEFSKDSRSQVALISIFAFVIWIGLVGSIDQIFPETQHLEGEIRIKKNLPLVSKYCINISIIGISVMGAVTGFNSILAVYNRFKKRDNRFEFEQNSKLIVLKQNLNTLMQNYEEIFELLQVKEVEFENLTHRRVHNELELQEINELSEQINNYKKYLRVIKQNIGKINKKMNDLDSSTSFFFDVLNLNFAKFEPVLNQMLFFYCIYRILSVFCVKVPFFVYELFTATASDAPSLSISLTSFLQKRYAASDELSLLNKVELIISVFFFLSCLTGVSSTINNSILIFSKLSKSRLGAKMKKPSQTEKSIRNRLDQLLLELPQINFVSNCERLLVSQLTATYIMSTSIMIRSTFSTSSMNIINGLFNLFEFKIHYLDRLFEFWFFVSCLTTVGLLVFEKKIQFLQVFTKEDLFDEESFIVSDGYQ